MKDEEMEKAYNSFAKFYLTFLSKLKLTFNLKEFNETFRYIVRKNENYDNKQVERIINKTTKKEK